MTARPEFKISRLWALEIVFLLGSGAASAQQLYRLSEVGTFSDEAPTIAVDMNASGDIVGWTNAFEARTFLWDGNTLKDLTPGRPYSWVPVGVNNSGKAAIISDYFGDDQENASIAHLWNGSRLVPFNNTSSWATDINESGWVAGHSSQGGFVWNGQTKQFIGRLPGGGFGFPNAINSLGHVTGSATNASGEHVAIFWNGSVMRELEPTLGRFASGVAINAAGHVAGNYGNNEGFNPENGFFWNGTTATPVGTLGGSEALVVAMNGSDQVIGSSTLSGDTQTHAFLWENGTMTDLGALAGGYSFASAINNAGVVTGRSFLIADNFQSQRAFVWKDGRMFDLNALIDPSDPLKHQVTLSEGVDINARGQIAVNGCKQERRCGAFLVTPLEYEVVFVRPQAGSVWRRGATMVARAALMDGQGKRITDARAASLVKIPCKMKFSVSGAQTKAPACMTYNATTNEFLFTWTLGATGSGPASIKVSSTYKFGMPKTITTSASRAISIN